MESSNHRGIHQRQLHHRQQIVDLGNPVRCHIVATFSTAQYRLIRKKNSVQLWATLQHFLRSLACNPCVPQDWQMYLHDPFCLSPDHLLSMIEKAPRRLEELEFQKSWLLGGIVVSFALRDLWVSAENQENPQQVELPTSLHSFPYYIGGVCIGFAGHRLGLWDTWDPHPGQRKMDVPEVIPVQEKLSFTWFLLDVATFYLLTMKRIGDAATHNGACNGMTANRQNAWNPKLGWFHAIPLSMSLHVVFDSRQVWLHDIAWYYVCKECTSKCFK